MKNVIITGSSHGFGYLSVLTLARNGYKVWATMRHADGKNAAIKKELLDIARKESLQIGVLDMDVTSEQSVQQAIRSVGEKDGKIDILINNAGIMYVGITEAYSVQQVQDQFDTNFFGIIRTIKAATPFMRQQKDGLIVNVTSLAGRLSFPYFGIYCASKHAVEAYSQSLRYELAPFGIEVCIVEPGPFGTNLLTYTGPQEDDQQALGSYGDFRSVPKAMLEGFINFYESDAAPNPQQVADDIAALVNKRKGEREERIVSGIDYGVVDYNNKVAPIQQALVRDGLHMGHLLVIANN